MFGYSIPGSARFALGSTIAGVNYSPGAAQINFTGFAPTVSMIFPPSRVSWIGLEVLHVGVSAARSSWIGLEVLHPGDSSARSSWIGVEVLRSIEAAVEQAGGVFILW